MNKDKWVTKEGVKIPIRELGDTHLLNIVKMLRRSGLHAQYKEYIEASSAMSGLQGEMALYYAESDCERMMDMPIDEYLGTRMPIYLPLLKEVKRRKLNTDEGGAIKKVQEAVLYDEMMRSVGVRWV